MSKSCEVVKIRSVKRHTDRAAHPEELEAGSTNADAPSLNLPMARRSRVFVHATTLAKGGIQANTGVMHMEVVYEVKNGWHARSKRAGQYLLC
jgi:hypothetical protein